MIWAPDFEPIAYASAVIVKPKVMAMDWTKGTGRSSGMKFWSSMTPMAALVPLEPS